MIVSSRLAVTSRPHARIAPRAAPSTRYAGTRPAAAWTDFQLICTIADGRNVSADSFWRDGDWRCELSLA